MTTTATGAPEAKAEAPASASAPTPITPPTPILDLDAIKRESAQAAKAELLGQFKDATGFDSLDAFKTSKLKDEGKLQELADNHAKEAQQFKAKFQKAAISQAILSAAAAAVDPALLVDLLAGRAECNDEGHVLVGGKSAADAVAALLAEKPFLAKAQSGTGSGAGASETGVKTMARATFDGLSPAQRAAAIKAGTVITD